MELNIRKELDTPSLEYNTEMSGSDPVLGRGFIPLEDTVHHIDSKHSVSEPLNEATHRVPEPDISSEIVPAQEGSKSLQMRNSHVSYEIPDGGWGWVMVGSAFFCSVGNELLSRNVHFNSLHQS